MKNKGMNTMVLKLLHKIKVHPLLSILFFIGWYYKILPELFIIYLSLTFHELSHVIVGMKLGYGIQSIEILPIGERARIIGLEDALPSEDLIISLAGPIVSIFFGLIGLLVLFIFNGIHRDFIEFFFIINFGIGLFNLIPAYPLDGGRILRAILLHYIDISNANRMSIIVSRSIAIIFFILGIIQFLKTNYNISLLTISSFIWISSFREEKKLQFSIMRQLVYKQRNLKKKRTLEVKNIIALCNTPVSCVLKLLRFHKYYRIQVVNEHLESLGVIEEKELYDKIIEKGYYAKIEELL